MSLNKKAEMSGDLKDIIIILMSFIAITFVAIYLSSFLSSTGSKKACETWVNIQSTPILKEFGPLQSSCITAKETIKNARKEEIYKQLANSMYDCWDMYGQGEADFYSDIDWLGSDTYCRICSEIKISSDLDQERRNINIDDFESYLTNNNPSGSRESYAEFFIKAENAEVNFGSGEITLDPEVNLYTIFAVDKRSDWSTEGILKNFVFEPGAILLAGKQVPVLNKVPGKVGGLIKGGKAGGWIGLAITYVATVGLVTLADGSVLDPTLLLLSSDDPRIQECDAGIYYKPASSIG